MDDVSSGLTIPAIAATSRPSDMLAAVQVWEQVLSVPESEPEAADDWREAARVCARNRRPHPDRLGDELLPIAYQVCQDQPEARGVAPHLH